MSRAAYFIFQKYNYSRIRTIKNYLQTHGINAIFIFGRAKPEETWNIKFY